MFIPLLLILSISSAQAMRLDVSTECTKNTSDREHWQQTLGQRDNLRRGSFLVDLKTLIKTIPRVLKKNEPAIPSDWIHKDGHEALGSDECSLTWIGHATFLIQSGALNGLIDPFWGDYTLGPLTLYKRLVPPGLAKEDVPKLSFIALTDNHVDHCDNDALLFFCTRDNPIALVPDGDQDHFIKLGFSHVVACQWGDSVTLKKEPDLLECVFLPAAHDSDHNAWWGSWLFNTKDLSIYHGGDTGDSKHFDAIAQRPHKIDIALLPIAPYTMRKLQQAAHIDQAEAIDAFKRLQARVLVPMHCCTLPYCDDDPQECIEKLNEQWGKTEIAHDNFDVLRLLMLKFGKKYNAHQMIKQSQL